MGAKCDTHQELHPGYQYKNRLRLLAKLNPLEIVALNLLALRAREFLDAKVVVEVMGDQE